MKRVTVTTLLVLIALSVCYCWLFYPCQVMGPSDPVTVHTPAASDSSSINYHDDCLHPCIRLVNEGKWESQYMMIQSPYYAWNNKVENPIFYCSDDWKKWESGIELSNTPKTGFNSDPTLFVSGDTIWTFWRECGTPLCDSVGSSMITVGSYSLDGISFFEKKVYLRNEMMLGDTEQSPILIKKGDGLLFYAAWYEYEPKRRNKGIAIWRGTSLSNPDFVLVDTLSFPTVYTVDKWLQKKALGHIWYIPRPLQYDLWHFDLFEYKNALYMVSCAEKNDVIMLSVSYDGKHFKTCRKPLINNHYMENFVGYRQYYYKPTAFVKDDTLHLFYTANDKDDPNLNVLFHSQKSMIEIKSCLDNLLTQIRGSLLYAVVG